MKNVFKKLQYLQCCAVASNQSGKYMFGSYLICKIVMLPTLGEQEKLQDSQGDPQTNLSSLNVDLMKEIINFDFFFQSKYHLSGSKTCWQDQNVGMRNIKSQLANFKKFKDCNKRQLSTS